MSIRQFLHQVIFILNYNLIEAVVLIVLASFRKEAFWGVQRLVSFYHAKRKDAKFPPGDNHEILESSDTSRRELIKNLAVVPLFGAAFFGMAKKRGWISFEEKNLASEADAVSSASLLLGKSQ